MEIYTTRWDAAVCDMLEPRDHVGPNEDFNQGYRSVDEITPWAERDEVARLAAMLPQETVDAVEAEIAATVADAENQPFPAPEDLYYRLTDEQTHR